LHLEPPPPRQNAVITMSHSWCSWMLLMQWK